MPQTILSVTLEVEPESCGRLSRLVEQLRLDEERPPPGFRQEYDRLKTFIPVLHFLSLNVFPSADYDPVFVLEANFDGPASVFWGQLEAALGSQLRDMVRCCKKPAVENLGELYVAVTSPESRYPLAPYFEAMTIRPSVFHQGNRGLNRDRILQEGELFSAVRAELTLPAYRTMSAEQIHSNLRTNLMPMFPWLEQKEPVRISTTEGLSDLWRMFAFVFLALFVLSLPGLLVLAPLQILDPDWRRALVDSTHTLYLFVVPIIGYLILGYLFYRLWAAREGEAAPTRSGGLTLGSLSREDKLTSLTNPFTFVLALFAVLATYVVLVSAIAAVLGMLFAHHATYRQLWLRIIPIIVFGLISAVTVTLPIIVLWLRRLERRDSFHDAPPISERMLREMERREDWIPQNHMGSIVLVKPGILRMALFRAGHLGLGLVLRVLARDGYLGSMRTVHFAHWVFINNASRLMFFSNFDQSWESYLDDFIEKAHGGLTLAWGSGVGFPPTRFLVLDGASHGRKFKAWARHSMAVSRFWFSAYPNYTVDQIERQARVASGLRKATLAAKEAAVWAKDL